jgi:hypothetical protein
MFAFQRLSTENSRIRKQYQAMKKSYEEKLNTTQSLANKKKEEIGVLQKHTDEYAAEVLKFKEVIKVFFFHHLFYS